MVWWIMAAGAVGTGARYLVGVWAIERLGAAFPYGTLIVNLAGCFALGVVAHIATASAWSPQLRGAVAIGFLGGFTTYSSFNQETLDDDRPRGDGSCAAERRDDADGRAGCRLARSRRRAPTCGIVPRMRILLPMLAAAALSSAAPLPVELRAQAQPSETGSWRQWGGPTRNFMVPATGLADQWPAAGPPMLWSRPLGPGHSAILVDEGRLYTMYRAGNGRAKQGPWEAEETVVAMDAASGKTLWEHKYPSRREDFSFGAGPHSTPLIVGDRLFTIGTNKQMFAFDKKIGKDPLVARPDQGVQLTRVAHPPGREDRLRMQPDRIPRHDHLQRGRSGPVGDGVPAERWRRGLEERRLPDLRGAADPDRDGRPPAAGDFRRRHRQRPGPSQRQGAVVAPARSRQRPELRARRFSGPTTSCSCRRPTAPAAGRFS